MAQSNPLNKQWISAGVDGLWVGFYGSDGLFAGGHGTLVKGERSWMQRWQAVKTLSPEIPEENRVTITGDDKPQGFFVFDRTDSPTAGITVADRTQALESEMRGLNDATRNQMRLLLVDPDPGTGLRQQLNIIGHSQAKANEYGQASAAGWQIIDLWQGEMSNGSPTGLEEQTGHAADFTYTFERRSTYPDSVAMVAATEGTDRASGNMFADTYRFIRGAVYGDGTITEINLPQTPAAIDTDLDVFAVEIVKRDSAGVVTVLTPTTDYTTTLSPPRTTMVAPLVDDARYTINLKY